MRYPKFIESGAAIGFAAPSFGAASEPYRTAFSCALKRFYDWGYKIIPGPNVYKGDGIGISSTPEKCGEELTEMYLSGDVDAIISVGGGELMCETMDYVDLNAIRLAKPKLFMGLSDNTNMVFLLTTLCDTASVYGPCAPAFGQQPLHSSLLDAKNLLEGTKLMETGYDLYEKESRKDEDHPLETYHVTEPRVIRAFVPDGAGGLREADSREEITLHGRLVGGCMDCLTTLTGTRYDRVGDFTEKYRADGILWFLEACDLNVFGIRRAIWQMKRAGWFSHAAGFLIGRPYCHGQVLMSLDQYRAVTDELAELGVPVLMDLDIGHIPPQIPILSGSLATVTLQGQSFLLTHECI